MIHYNKTINVKFKFKHRYSSKYKIRIIGCVSLNKTIINRIVNNFRIIKWVFSSRIMLFVILLKFNHNSFRVSLNYFKAKSKNPKNWVLIITIPKINIIIKEIEINSPF